MQIETLKVKLPTIRSNGSSGCTLLGFNLPSLIEKMKQSYTWANGELNAMILLNSPHKQILLTALHEGTEIKSFQSGESTSIQVIKGRLRFYIRRYSVTLNEGQMITLDEKIKYGLTGQEETVFLITISNGITNTSKN